MSALVWLGLVAGENEEIRAGGDDHGLLVKAGGQARRDIELHPVGFRAGGGLRTRQSPDGERAVSSMFRDEKSA